MNTMADGARERCVAQIGEALFGQPGLTLMELAEKVKASRSNASPLGYVRVEAIKALREDDEVTGVMVHVDERTDSVPVYLAAQPSTAGQGDALELLERYDWAVSALDAELNEGWDEDGRRARLQSDRDEVRAELIAALSARQAVGQEPVASVEFINGHAAELVYTGAAMPDGQHELYAAPPAQAVDLVDFKALYRAYVRLLESGMDRIRDLGGSCDPVDVMEANDVDLQAARRVIDSKAVGK